MCYWDGAGWLQGTIVEENTDDNELDGEAVANWIVYYEVDDTSVAHLLTAAMYTVPVAGEGDEADESWARPLACAKHGAWYLLLD